MKLYFNFKNRLGRILWTLLLLVSTSFVSFSQAIPTPGISATEVGNSIFGRGVTVLSATKISGEATQIASFTGGIGAGFSIEQGICLTTGNIDKSFKPNNTNNSTIEATSATYNDSDLTGINPQAIHDVVGYEFEVQLSPDVTRLVVSYQFASEEYPDFVGTIFNDAFGFFISGPGIAGIQNIATVPTSSPSLPVTVSNINAGYSGPGGAGCTPITEPMHFEYNAYYINNGHGVPVSGTCETPLFGVKPVITEYNGITKLITATIENLTPGETYTFKMVLADTADTSHDSAVFIKNIIAYHDTDGDGIDDFFDLDDDGDGIRDSDEDLNPDQDGDPLTVPNDSDGDGLYDHLDLDSDNDGIPDNVEAQSSIGYIAPSGIDLDGNGIDDNYESVPGAGEGLSPLNTDGAEGLDYLDLDSDNDGINDTLEAGLTLSGNDNDQDGLDDAYDDTNTYLDPAGTIDNPLTGAVIFPDIDGDAAFGGEVDYRDDKEDTTDTDGDTIYDVVDVDDDNDGIPDVDECHPVTNMDSAHIINTQTTANLNTTTITDPIVFDVTTANNVLLNASYVPNITTTETGNTIADFNGTQTYFAVDIDTKNTVDIQGVLTITFPRQVSKADIKFADISSHINSPNISLTLTLLSHEATMTLLQTDGDFTLEGNTIKSAISTTTDGTGIVEFLGAFTELKFKIGRYAPRNHQGSVWLHMNMRYEMCSDTDHDGFADYIDLDADNDGVYDLMESGQLTHGANDTDNNGVIDGDLSIFGANGLCNAIETGDTVTTPTLDTDTDGAIDAIDLDADNDLCSDSDEAYDLAGADGGGGQYGTGEPAATNSNGTVVAATYPIPVDNDADGRYDFQQYTEALPPVSITVQPLDQLDLLEGDNALFTVTVPASLIDVQYQWQVSTNSGATWSNLLNDSVYSGVTTTTLSVAGVTLAMNNNLYRLVISTPTYICDEDVISDEALLTVIEIPTLIINNPTVPEGTVLEFIATLSNPTTEDIVINFVSADVTAVAPADYTALALTTLTIPAGSTSIVLPILPTVDDTIVETDETMQLNATVISGVTTNTTAQGIGTITDNEPSFWITSPTVSEATDLAFIVHLTNTTIVPIVIEVTSADVTATAPADYIALATTAVTIPVGSTSVAVPLIATVDDALVEPTETMELNGVLVSGVTVNTTATGIGTILDNEPELLINNPTVNEGDDLIFTATLSVSTSEDIIVEIVTANGTAIAPDDYTGFTTQTLTFLAGTTVATTTIPIVTTVDDVLFEGDEIMYLNATVISGTVINPTTQGIGTILDNEPTFSISSLTVTEGDDFVFSVDLDMPTSEDIVIDVVSVDATAISPDDYAALATTRLTIPAGATQVLVPVITTVDDTILEPDETMLLNGTLVSGITTNTTAQGVGKILANDTNLQTAYTVSKEANPIAVSVAEEVITYTITVTNIIDEGVQISVHDPLVADLTLQEADGTTGDLNANNILDAGEVWVYVGTYTVTLDDLLGEGIDENGVIDGDGDVDNTVYVNGYTVSGAQVTTVTAVAVVKIKFIFIPEAFSPDDDGVNDVFEIIGIAKAYPGFVLEVYNRWGNLVYEYSNEGKENPEWWDGVSQGRVTIAAGEKVPDGTYYYIIDFKADDRAPLLDWIYISRNK